MSATTLWTACGRHRDMQTTQGISLKSPLCDYLRKSLLFPRENKKSSFTWFIYSVYVGFKIYHEFVLITWLGERNILLYETSLLKEDKAGKPQQLGAQSHGSDLQRNDPVRQNSCFRWKSWQTVKKGAEGSTLRRMSHNQGCGKHLHF